MSQITCNVSTILSYMSGNQGLTKKTIHYDRKNLGVDDIEVLSSSIIDDTSMGYVSRNLILPNKKHIKLFEGKEGILVSRNGNAGILTYLPKGKYTMNDHAYILYIKEEFINDIDAYWLSLALQREALKFLSITEGNKTWNITRFMNEGKINIPTLKDGSYDIDKQKETALRYQEIEKQKKLLLSKIEYLNKTKIETENEETTNYKYIKISDLFNPIGGNGHYTNTYCYENVGKFPIYSSNNSKIFGNINTYDYDGDFLTWSIVGCAGYINEYNGKFSITNNRGILVPTKEYKNIDLSYVKYVLEPIFRKHKKGRIGINGKNEYTTLNPTAIKNIKEKIKIPIDKKGDFDIEKQREIAQKIATIESIKQDLYNKILSLVNIHITYKENFITY